MLGQVGKTLADSLHQSAGSGSLHRTAVSAADAGATPPPPHATWHSYYNELALQLIALTTAAGKPVLGWLHSVPPARPVHVPSFYRTLDVSQNIGCGQRI